MLVAQISDLHLVEKDGHWLSEPATQVKERLLRTISHLNALNPRPDVVLVTGDVTDKGTEASYAHARELLAALEIPYYIIPGNHDRREELRKTFCDRSYMPAQGFLHYVVDDYPIRLIGLDTLVEGEDCGCLCPERMVWLEKVLKADSQKPTLIFMHHPPIKIGMSLFDGINCHAPSNFEGLIAESKNVMGIVTGHYHHLCVGSFGGKVCFLAPSVAPVHYFAHPQDMYVSALELDDPTITLHKWQGGTLLTSYVVRVKQTLHRIDWKVVGQKAPC